MVRKFVLNQRVRISPEACQAQASPDGVYIIVRLLPESQDGRYDYHLKSQAGDRVATESALSAIVD